MKQSCSSESYKFVDSSPDGSLRTDRETRRLIRSHAMSRAAAARKQNSSWGQHNRRQYPVLQLDLQEGEGRKFEATALDSAGSNSSARQRGLTPAEVPETLIPPRVRSSGYESMRIHYGFDLLDVSALTTFHSGRLTSELLFQNPARLVHVLRCRQWSYLSYLPSRYGYNTCLDDAAHCVAARVRQWMSSPSDPPSSKVLWLYSKSLNSLQSALNDPTLYLKPEVLCATNILAMYELLDSAGSQSWIRHVAGASALTRLRGPQCYQSDFEKALFLAQVGPNYTETLINNDRCFLEQDIWENVLRSTVMETDTLSDSSGIIVLLWTIVCPIPSLFQDIQNTICTSTNIDIRTVRTLSARVQEIRSSLSHWRTKYEQYCQSHHSPPTTSGVGKHHDTMGVYMANQIVINRLSVSLNPSLEPDTENETQVLARRLVELDRMLIFENPRASLFMKFKLISAQATLDTKDQWQRAIQISIANPTTREVSPCISRPVFEDWVRRKGRRVTSPSATAAAASAGTVGILYRTQDI